MLKKELLTPIVEISYCTVALFMLYFLQTGIPKNPVKEVLYENPRDFYPC